MLRFICAHLRARNSSPEHALACRARELLFEKQGPVYAHFMKWLNGRAADRQTACAFLQEHLEYVPEVEQVG